MCSLNQTIDTLGHVLVEITTLTGKTVTFLSFITSYNFQRTETEKLINCTRTVLLCLVGEMKKVSLKTSDLIKRTMFRK